MTRCMTSTSLNWHRRGVEELDENYTDDYEFTALRGTRGLKGRFYLRDNIHDMTFTLDENRTAVVYASTVRQICGDIPCKKRGRKYIYKLPLKENEELIASLSITKQYLQLLRDSCNFCLAFVTIFSKNWNLATPALHHGKNWNDSN